MEKLQIAKYGMMQVTAIVYGILASGAGVKVCNNTFPVEAPRPGGFYHAMLFRDYGFLLFAVVLAWTALVSYLSSPISAWEFDSDSLANSGFILAIFLTILSTYCAYGGFSSLLYATYGMTDK